MRTGLVFCTALLCAGVSLAADAVSAPPPKLYPLASKTLMLGAARAGDALVVVGDRGFILRSTDNGATWAQQAAPVSVMLTAVHMTSPASGWAVGHDATILSTDDGGVTWTKRFEDAELETPLFDVWFENANHGIAVGAYGLLLETTDGGATWEERRISADEPHLYTITSGTDGALFTVGEMGSVFRSDDRGATWTALPSPYEGTFFGALSLKDGGLLIYGLRGHLFRSDDGGKSWQTLASDTEGSLVGAVQRADGSVVVVGLSGTVMTSVDGRTFARTTLPDREAMGAAIETPAGKLMLIGEKGPQMMEATR
jgi:photosystem II stability/assembly factor-like uncharacterized protein